MTSPPAEIQQEILDFIIRALPHHTEPTAVNDSWDSPRRALLACARVCWSWHRYTLPHNFKSITLHTTSQRRMDTWESLTKSNPDINSSVRDLALVVGVGEGPGATIVDQKGGRSLETMCGQLTELQNLTVISNLFYDRDYQNLTTRPPLLRAIQRLCSMPKLHTLHLVDLKLPISLLFRARSLIELTLTTCNGVIFDIPSLGVGLLDNGVPLPTSLKKLRIAGPFPGQYQSWTSMQPSHAIHRLTSNVVDFSIDLTYPTMCDVALVRASNMVSLTLELFHRSLSLNWMPLIERCRSFPWPSLTSLVALKFAITVDRPGCQEYDTFPGSNSGLQVLYRFEESLALAVTAPSLRTLTLQYAVKNAIVYDRQSLEAIVGCIYTPALNNLLLHQFPSLIAFNTVLEMGGTVCPSIMGQCDESVEDDFDLEAELEMDEENRRNGGRADEGLSNEIQALVRKFLPSLFGMFGRESSGDFSASVETYWKHYPVWKETTFG